MPNSPCMARASEVMLMTMQNKEVPVVHEGMEILFTDMNLLKSQHG